MLFNDRGQLSRSELEEVDRAAMQAMVQAVASAYAGQLVPTSDGVLLQPFQTDAAALSAELIAGGINIGGAIIVNDLDRPGPGGTVEISVTGVTVLQFTTPDDGDPYTVSSPAAGVANVEFYPASLTQAGYVTLANQSMGAGAKYFSDKVGIGTVSPLANSALDVRGYAYAYFAGILAFGGGNTPLAESAAATLQYDGSAHSHSLSLGVAAADYLPGEAGGLLLQGFNARALLRHKTAASPCFGFYDDNLSAYALGITATVALAKLTAGGANGSLTISGGLVTGYTAPT